MQPLKRPLEDSTHLGRIFPVIGRAGVFLLLGTDVGAVLDARNVGWIGKCEEGVLALLELGEGAGSDQFGAEPIVFFLRAVGPDDLGRLGEGCNLGNPLLQAFMFDVVGGIDGNSLVHGNHSRRKVEKRKLPWSGAGRGKTEPEGGMDFQPSRVRRVGRGW
jgi:hypothetical protein